jgi:hypothetical protein
MTTNLFPPNFLQPVIKSKFSIASPLSHFFSHHFFFFFDIKVDILIDNHPTRAACSSKTMSQIQLGSTSFQILSTLVRTASLARGRKREREAGSEKEKKGVRGERNDDFFINIFVC